MGLHHRVHTAGAGLAPPGSALIVGPDGGYVRYSPKCAPSARTASPCSNFSSRTRNSTPASVGFAEARNLVAAAGDVGALPFSELVVPDHHLAEVEVATWDHRPDEVLGHALIGWPARDRLRKDPFGSAAPPGWEPAALRATRDAERSRMTGQEAQPSYWLASK